MTLKGFLTTWGFVSKERTDKHNGLSRHVVGIAAELFDLQTPEEAARQHRIVTEIPKEKPPMVVDEPGVHAVVYVGRKPRW